MIAAATASAGEEDKDKITWRNVSTRLEAGRTDPSGTLQDQAEWAELAERSLALDPDVRRNTATGW